MVITGYKGTTRIRLSIAQNHPLMGVVLDFLGSKAREWNYDAKTSKWTPGARFYFYLDKKQELVLPVGYESALNEMLWHYDSHLNLEQEQTIEPRQIKIEMSKRYVPREEQVDLITFLSEDNPGRRALPLQTGKGKTFVSIAALTNLKQAALIVVSGLMDQWVDKLLEYTTLKRSDIYLLQTFPSIENLLKSKLKPKVLVGSLETLRLYAFARAEYRNLPMSFSRFLDYYGIGVKIIDEVHEKYNSIVSLDLLSRVKNNIYLSATFARNDRDGQRIFRTIYPDGIMFHGLEYEKYVKIFCYGYNGDVPEQRVVTIRGYMHAKYEYYLIKRPRKLKYFIDDVLVKLIHIHYLNIRNPKERLLIFVLSNQMAELLTLELGLKFPNLNIVSFIQNDKDDVFLNPKVDIIISSPFKCGTGKDIPMLRSIIDTFSTAAMTKVIQKLGRLRKLKSGAVPEYVSLFDMSTQSQVRQFEIRRTIYQTRALSYEEHVLYPT